MKKCNNIVLIDDDPLDNLVNKKLIEHLEITEHLEILLNGIEGINYLNELYKTNNPPNLVFVDLSMPGMNGFEFLEKYHAFPFEFIKEIKVIVFTSSPNEEDYERATYIGCDGFLISH